MTRTIILTRFAFLRRKLHQRLTGKGRGGGGGGGGKGGKGGLRGQSGFLTTLVSVIIFFVFYFNFNFLNRDYVKRVTPDAAFFAESDQPNITWMELRKKLLLDKNSSLAKVIIFGYMRGGSTLFSEIFNLDRSSHVLWHEPLDAFYQSFAGFEAHSIPLSILYHGNLTRRSPDDFEAAELTSYLQNLLSCRPETLPIETLAHFHLSYSLAFKAIYKCMEDLKVKAMVLNCKKPLQPICGHIDLIRRDMSISLKNKCPQLIAVIRSMMHYNDFAVQPLFINRAKSKAGTTQASAASPERLENSTKAELTDRIVSGLSGDLSNETKHNIDLLLEHQHCLFQLQPVVKECTRPAVNICRQASLVALKLIRMMFEGLEPTMQRIPDLHVIYYVRDPRAIATSRVEKTTRLTMFANNHGAVAESMILCRRMMEDVKAKRRLEAKYPGSVITVRYEDFVRSPLRHIREVFEKIGRPVPRDVSSWLSSRFKGTQDNGIYGTVRINPVSTSRNWISQISLRDALQMDEYCHDVLQEFGYMTLRPNKTRN